MIDQQSVERAAERFQLPEGSFERLSLRRDRKQRNRRIRAGALGVIVALAMGLALVKSMTSDGMPAHRPEPRPAPSGSLVYALDGDIYVSDLDGSNTVKIADGRSAADCLGFSGEYLRPSWSPDGRYVAFQRFTNCSDREKSGLISDVQGNVLATFPAQGWQIAWSPDSSRVAVWEVAFETIGVYGLDGTRQAQLTMPPGWAPSGDHDPMWMPDGTSVAILTGRARSNLELPLDGGPPRPLPRNAQAYTPLGASPVSPDGSLVAYVDHDALTVARTDGSGSVMVRTAERGTELGVIGFSPQGDRILFSSIVVENGGVADASLWSVSVDGSDPRVIVDGVMEGELLLR